MEKEGEYKVVKYYDVFFAHAGYKLLVRRRFLWWRYWDVLKVDPSGLSGRDWAEHYGCEIVDKTKDRRWDS